MYVIRVYMYEFLFARIVFSFCTCICKPLYIMWSLICMYMYVLYILSWNIYLTVSKLTICPHIVVTLKPLHYNLWSSFIWIEKWIKHHIVLLTKINLISRFNTIVTSSRISLEVLYFTCHRYSAAKAGVVKGGLTLFNSGHKQEACDEENIRVATS